jgi:hypothetical protein
VLGQHEKLQRIASESAKDRREQVGRFPWGGWSRTAATSVDFVPLAELDALFERTRAGTNRQTKRIAA